MSKIKFSVDTNLSGRNRTVAVRVYDNREDFLVAVDHDVTDNSASEAVTRTREQMPDHDFSDEPTAVTYSHAGYVIDDMVATIVLRTDIPLRTQTVVHEALHAAIAIYAMDAVIMKKGRKSKALKHLNAGNELLPHLVDDLSTEIVRKLKKRGIEVEPI